MLEHLVNAIAIAIAVYASGVFWRRKRSREQRATKTLQDAISSGQTEPASLHPTVDPNRCISIGACAEACPEGDIIGIINGSPELVRPTRCIGHGACAAACPVDAISLVFGTHRRGVELPHVKETFETNAEGIYIAGELGGMGLIRNAITQGKQAVERLAEGLDNGDPAVYDVAIVGAGPAGLAATLQAEKQRLRYITLEQDDIGGTVLTYPRHKIVMTQPMELPLYGTCRFREIQKEELLALWEEVIEKTGIRIHVHEKVESVSRRNGLLKVVSTRGEYCAKRVLLAIGRRGIPRKLGVSGEKSAKVTYRLIEPEQYKNKNVLVVGGGDSAVEAALALADQGGAAVTLSYRKGAFTRIKEKNQELIDQAMAKERLQVLFESQVKQIKSASVVLDVAGRALEILNEYVLISIGGELPTPFLKKAGVGIQMKYGER